jgi:hypothetical protein
MIRSTIVALCLISVAGVAQAEAEIRPLPRPASVAIAADPSFAPPNDVDPRKRPQGLTANGIDLALVSFAPQRDVEPLARPRTEEPADPFMTLARAPTPVPAAMAPLSAMAPVVLAEVPVLPGSPLAFAATPAPPMAGEALASMSSAGPRAPATMVGHTDRIMVLAARAAKAVGMAPAPGLRPRARVSPLLAAVQVPVAAVIAPVTRALRPAPRPAFQARRQPAAEAPEVVVQAAVVIPAPRKSAIVGRKGSVCGDNAIKGQALSPIIGRIQGCGVAEPVRVTSVSGVTLSQPADIDCNTARALKAWVDQGLQPQFGRNPVVQLQVAAGYACRSRNNIKGARISEHGRGKAIDLKGFVLASGDTVSVGPHWRSKGAGTALKAAHKSACGVFNTTLGPGSDGYHEDHLHFDTASGRGPYCR